MSKAGLYHSCKNMLEGGKPVGVSPFPGRQYFGFSELFVMILVICLTETIGRMLLLCLVADKRWGHFGPLGIGWNIHNESFMQDFGWLQRLKLRASTGYTGFKILILIKPFRHINITDEMYDNIIGSYLMSLANPDLQWQKHRIIMSVWI